MENPDRESVMEKYRSGIPDKHCFDIGTLPFMAAGKAGQDVDGGQGVGQGIEIGRLRGSSLLNFSIPQKLGRPSH
jgi:hypothetical protein